MTKLYARTQYDGCEYITAGKLYEIHDVKDTETACGRSFRILSDDEGELLLCNENKSNHLGRHGWQILTENEEPVVGNLVDAVRAAGIEVPLWITAPGLLDKQRVGGPWNIRPITIEHAITYMAAYHEQIHEFMESRMPAGHWDDDEQNSWAESTQEYFNHAVVVWVEYARSEIIRLGGDQNHDHIR